MNLTSPSQVKRLLVRYGMRPKKRLGQHFLIDRNVLTRIVDASEARPGVNVLEIGAGLGVVTREIAGRGARVVSVEVDPGFKPILDEVLAGIHGVEVVIADVLKLDLPSFV
ncbi:MAG: rRNA adenine N-6-methyltransferase family protein, partial [Armatimonadota bacterium]